MGRPRKPKPSYDVASFGKCILDFKPPTHKWGCLFIHSTVPTRCVKGKEVVLRATQSELDVFCVCFGRWERSKHLHGGWEKAINYKRGGESPISRPNELCDLQKITSWGFFCCVFHSFNNKFWENIWISRFIILVHQVFSKTGWATGLSLLGHEGTVRTYAKMNKPTREVCGAGRRLLVAGPRVHKKRS